MPKGQFTKGAMTSGNLNYHCKSGPDNLYDGASLLREIIGA